MSAAMLPITAFLRPPAHPAPNLKASSDASRRRWESACRSGAVTRTFTVDGPKLRSPTRRLEPKALPPMACRTKLWSTGARSSHASSAVDATVRTADSVASAKPMPATTSISQEGAAVAAPARFNAPASPCVAPIVPDPAKVVDDSPQGTIASRVKRRRNPRLP